MRAEQYGLWHGSLGTPQSQYLVILSYAPFRPGLHVKELPFVTVQVKLTLLLAVVAVPINTAFGVTFAILLVRSEFWGKTLVMSMLDLPFSISPVVTGEHPFHQFSAIACLPGVGCACP